jgi:uncharacterized iron-regulated protein
MRDTFIPSAICALLCAGLTACASSASESSIWDVRAARFIDEPQLVAELAAARYRLLGEVHDNPAHHAIRARLITQIAATGARPAVVFEQFDLDQDEALVAAQAAGGDAEQLAEAAHLDARGWAWPLHKPLLDAALAARLPVRAGNLPRARLRGDAPAALGGSAAMRLRAARWGEPQAAQLRADILDSHCGALPEAAVPRLVLAQRMRDAAMAQALIDAATADGAILVAGNGHVRADLAVPLYLHAAGLPDAQARSLGVGFIEVDGEERRADDFPQRVAADHPGFDYLWLTPPVAREDPCRGAPLRTAPAAPSRVRPQSGLIGLQHVLAHAHEIEGLGVEQPVVDQPVDQRVQAERERARGHVVADQAAAHRAPQLALDLGQAFVAPAQVAVAHGEQFVDVFDLVRGDLEDAARCRVRGSDAQRVHEAIADGGHRVVAIGGHAAHRHRLLQRHDGALHHRVEEIGLVLEVPVDCAACELGGLRNILQRGAGYTMLLEEQLGRVENAVASRLGFFLRAANHDFWRS